MTRFTMNLTGEERAILDGSRGDVLRKAMESVVRYGEIFGAGRLAPLDHDSHIVTSVGVPMLKPIFSLMDDLVREGLVAPRPFTADPRPLDYKKCPAAFLKKPSTGSVPRF